MMEAVNTSERCVNFYESTRRNIPDDINLQELHMYHDDTATYLTAVCCVYYM
jgi:hypothetical protein